MNLTRLNRIALLLAFAGLFVAGVLSLAHVLKIDPPCGPSGDCGAVTNHASSKWFTIPVAYFGFGAYLTLAFLAVLRAIQGVERNPRLVTIGYLVSAAGTLISMFLTAYALFVIRATCLWCVASAGIMMATLVVHAVMAQRLASVEAPRASEPPAPAVAANPKAVAFDIRFFAGLGLALVLSLGMMGRSMDSKARITIIDPKAVKKYSPADFAPVGAHSLGPADAPVTIVEFADLMCSACRKAHGGMHALLEEYPTTLRLVFRHYPFYQDPEHQLSLPAAFIAESAAQTGKFWQYLDMVYGGEDAPQNSEELFGMASAINLDVPEIRRRMSDENDPIYDRIMSDLKIANGCGFMETPTFVVIANNGEIAFANARTLSGLLGGPAYQRLLRPNAAR